MPTAPFLAPERDGPTKIGRPKIAGGAEQYTVPGVVLTAASTTGILTPGVDAYAPFWVGTPIVVDQLAFEVGTAASAGVTSRVGIYAADADWQPIGGPLADSGAIAVDSTGVKTYTPSSPIYLQRGRYVEVGNTSATTGPSVRLYAGSLITGIPTAMGNLFVNKLSVARAYAAFPTPGTAWNTVGTAATPTMYFVVFRVLAP